MGSYVVSREELFSALSQALDGLEGEVFREDFQEAVDDLLSEYPYFTDFYVDGELEVRLP